MQARRITTVAAVVLFVAGGALAQAQGNYILPPRTVEDILAVLDQYKPDPAAAQKTREAIDRQPPATTNQNEVALFYHERAGVAGGIGLVSKQIADFQLYPMRVR